MGVLTFEKEITTSIPQAKMFKVFILESDTLIPKIMPQVSIEFLEGNGGPGTIKKTSFAEGGEIKYIKTKIEATDKDNFIHCYNVIGGEPWMDELEKTSYEIKIVASPDGGSIVKSISKYYPKEGCQINEERVKAGAEKAFSMFKAIEAYVLANPDAC
ncbi:major allergen Pru ar 1 [Ricinus communis]|uniref:Major allergen Pru av, putative n=1 Tax=Ricinus communis TaxID=3988 RepID=B9RTD0_RICCO|nr:major allergen Pru ar 1 [Ricinus communis]EEF45613.1 Major allergen Pru av, putative [Ricinus communis]|eukprot:XP_002516999.1 major allergen Pru ar 1 [Ricinus communis]